MLLTAEFSKGDPPRNLHSFTVKLLIGPAVGLVSWQGTSPLKLLMLGKAFYGLDLKYQVTLAAKAES